jgi:hypothetical protein
MRMFAKKQQKRRVYQTAKIRERFERNERTGKDIYARIADLKNLARDDLAHGVFMLFREAKHQSQLIRQSIKDRTQHDCDFGGMSEGDRATCLAEDTAYALREHVTNPQTLFQAMSEQLPDVHFTIQQQDAVSMVAAMIREQRLEGILEDLRLAGILNEPSKRPRARRQTGLNRANSETRSERAEDTIGTPIA